MKIGSLKFVTRIGFPWQSMNWSPRQLLSTSDEELSQIKGLSLEFNP